MVVVVDCVAVRGECVCVTVVVGDVVVVCVVVVGVAEGWCIVLLLP